MVICLLNSNVLAPVTLPTLRLADSMVDDIVGLVMSVVTAIGAIPSGSSLNDMKAALAGVLPTKQVPMSAIGMDWLLHFAFPKEMSDWSFMIFSSVA